MDYMSLKSGTDIRGIASEGVLGQDINLTNEAVETIAAAFLVWCEKHIGKKTSEMRIAIGHDSRISADRIFSCLIKTFTKYGVNVLDCGLASTPSMFMSIIDLPCDCSISVTASHHPFNRNGLKFFTEDGGLEAEDIGEILGYAQNGNTPAVVIDGNCEKVDYMAKYCERLREMIKSGVNSENYDKPLDGFKIVVDAGNGAGGFYASSVLAPLGADISGSQFLEPDGMFPNHVPNPENEVAMAAISGAVKSSKSDLGIIFDTDVDRAAVVDKNGKEINRNSLIAVASAIALVDNDGGTIVTDSTTSDGLRDYINLTLGGKHHRFQRGYKNVINEAIRLNNEGVNCPLAIETSGHAAMRENYFLDDGAYLVTKIIIKMAALKKSGKEIDSLIAELKEAAESAEIRLPITEQDFKTRGEALLVSLQNYAKKANWDIAPDNHDGIRISFPKEDGDGWFLLRLSVHDPILPINIESNSTGGVEKLTAHLVSFLEKNCDGIDISPVK